jgi:hypothetical protein
LAYKIQTPGNYPEENIQHSEHSESLKSRIRLQLPLLQVKNYEIYVKFFSTVFLMDGVVEYVIGKKIWLKNSLSQSEGG